MDEYYRDTKEAIPYYEKFLTLSDNPEMRAKVEAWLEDAKKGMALPFEAVNELSPEAKELLDKRTEQFETLRRQLIDRYESEIAKLREGVSTVVVTVAETESEVKETPAAPAEVEDKPETKPEVAAVENKVEEPKPSKADLKKLEEEKKKEAARLAKEKKEREEKIDAFVKNIVKAGSDAAETTVITAKDLPKVPESQAKIELELTEEEKEPEQPAVDTAAKAEEPAAPEPPKEKEPRIHVVGQGDNLGNISRKYYGEFKRWKDIAEANKEILPDPNKLKIGMKLVIPE